MTFGQKLAAAAGRFFRFLKEHLGLVIAVVVAAALIVAGAILLSAYLRRPSSEPEDTSGSGIPSDTAAPPDTSLSVTSLDGSSDIPGTLPSGVTDTALSEPTETTVPVPTDIPLTLLRMDAIEVRETTDDGILLVGGTIEVPVFSNNDEDPAIARINESLAAYCENLRRAAVKKIRPVAENDLRSDSPNIPFAYNVTATVTISSDTSVSIFFKAKTYTGGENSSVYGYGVAYNVETGDQYTLEDVFGDRLSEASALILGRVKAAADGSPDDYYPDRDGLVDFYGLADRWYFSEDGFTVFYVPYELAGFEAGILTFTVPYGDLNSVIRFNPAYLSAQ